MNARIRSGVCFIGKTNSGEDNVVRPDDVEAMIDEGVMIGAANQQTAELGRQYTSRAMPW